MKKDRLLILDMDETLLHTECFRDNDYIPEGSYNFKFPLGAEDDETWYFTIKRPFIDELMKYAFDNFKVAIWTAGGSDYASTVIEKCGIDVNKLEFFWTRERCTMKFDYMSQSNYGEKNLGKVKNLGWDLDRVLIVDDVRMTANNNYGNLIKISSYLNSSKDTELLKLISYLETIKDEPNYRTIEKRGWLNI